MSTWLDLQLPLQSVPINTKVVSSNLVHGEVYSINTIVCDEVCQWFVAGLWLVCDEVCQWFVAGLWLVCDEVCQ